MSQKIYTIWHSTHPIEEFIEMLQAYNIQTLVDVRSLPWSRAFPQYNSETLADTLHQHGVRYVYLKDLWGRRKVLPGSHNTAWHNKSFQWYADYMETDQWLQAVKELEQIAIESRTAYMCAEAVWRRCHRSMISDRLKASWRTVEHIMSATKITEHPYTSPAHVSDGHLTYEE